MRRHSHAVDKSSSYVAIAGTYSRHLFIHRELIMPLRHRDILLERYLSPMMRRCLNERNQRKWSHQ